ncbi:MAG: serine protease [Planctomycetota bacterium]|nr:serine protease [Planctomycetota bacterium]
MKKEKNWVNATLVGLFGVAFIGLAGMCVWLTKVNEPKKIDVKFEIKRESIVESWHYNKFLRTVVGVRSNRGIGSGVKVFSGLVKGTQESYILTAAHLFGENDEASPARKAMVVNYNYSIPELEIRAGEVVAIDFVRDLALIKMNEPAHFLHVASLNKNGTPLIFTPVWAVGGSLGLQPRPTFGQITNSLDKDIWEFNAPIFPGNSGGAVFAEDGSLLGISVRVMALLISGDGQSFRRWLPINEAFPYSATELPVAGGREIPVGSIMPLPNMGGMVSRLSIEKFLEEKGYEFISK